MRKSHILAIYKSATAASQAAAFLRRNGIGKLVRLQPLYQEWLLKDEMAVSVIVDQAKLNVVQRLLREHTQAVSLFSFSDYPASLEFGAQTVSNAIPNAKELRRRAASLARSFINSATPLRHGGINELRNKLRSIEKAIAVVRNNLASSGRAESASVSVAQWGVAENVVESKAPAEWILDNWHLVRGHVRTTEKALSSIKTGKLPMGGEGEMARYPRVCALATELVTTTNGTISPETISAYLDSYQSVLPLYNRELELLPALLTYSLLDYLSGLCRNVARNQVETELANFWSSRLISAARGDHRQLARLVARLEADVPKPSASIIDILVSRLQEEDVVVPGLNDWLESSCALSLSDTLQELHGKQSVEQIAFRNIAVSLKLLSSLNWWEDILEKCSPLERVLSRDPAKTYARMDNPSKKKYREAAYLISKGSSHDEIAVAEKALVLSQDEPEGVKHHIGYYLIDKGRPRLERLVGTRFGLGARLRRTLKIDHAEYFLALTTVISLVLGAAVFRIWHALLPVSLPWDIVSTVALSVIVIDLAIRIAQRITLQIVSPTLLPKLDFSKGIPPEYATSVVVPTLLLTAESVRSECERLEIRYLSNPDPNLRFGLLSDFSDAPHKTTLEDAEILEVARTGIRKLNDKYPGQQFFIFHRERQWSDSEDIWLGWERKRGKIEQFNAWLSGEDSKGASLLEGDPDQIRASVFAITLDADTQLALGTAQRLVGTMAHPLNRPVLSADGRTVLRGYGVIQPKVSTTLPSATATYFSRIMSSAKGVDPYNHISADFYQDLSGETNYQGKGIYDVRAFHEVLKGRIPASYVLSHDLLEGCYVRAGYASDIELFDLFPSDYISFSDREHRWIRGDWQIIGWLRNMAPLSGDRHENNPFSLLNKWKIVDNLRRSLLPVATLVAVLLGWVVYRSPLFEIVVIISYASSPLRSLFVLMAQRKLPGDLFSQEYGHQVARTFVNLAFIPHAAFRALDAVVRVLYRKYVSHHYLLEWQTAAETERTAVERQRDFLIGLSWIPLTFVSVIVAVAFTRHITIVSPTIVLWIVSPYLLLLLQRTTGRKIRLLSKRVSANDRTELGQLARRTWRYFDDFMNAEHHFLPPDNYQEKLNVAVDPRTSPTNIGLGLVAVLAARDFGYLSTLATADALEWTLSTVMGMETYKGHLYNWYSTASCKPIGVRYVSMADSGNFVGALWSLEKGIQELQDRPIVGDEILSGISDTLPLAFAHSGEQEKLFKARQIIREAGGKKLGDLEGAVVRLAVMARPGGSATYWQEKLRAQLEMWQTGFEMFLDWASLLYDVPKGGLLPLGGQAHEWRRQALSTVPSLRQLADGNVSGVAGLISLANDPNLSVPEETKEWLRDVAQAFERAKTNARELSEKLTRLEKMVCDVADRTDFAFLYDNEPRVFHIGFNADSQEFDHAHYGLLASESRLSSFISIANGQVPVEHWWALERRMSTYMGNTVLLSWSGTMFEYLMPLLFTRMYEGSLLDQACHSAVSSQKSYGDSLGLPWGISESGYSAIDANRSYQYFAFGSPGLGMRQGLADDLVIAPYATMLSLMVDPKESIRNIHVLEEEGMVGDYGLYEAIDYTRERNSAGKKGVIVCSYMAHHQGMSLLAMSNLLHDGAVQRRFHAQLRVRSCESLLFEVAPDHAPEAKWIPPDADAGKKVELHVKKVNLAEEKVSVVLPKVATFSNGAYSLMVSHRGGGYSSWRNFILNRWRADASRDHYGQFIYVQDHEEGVFWSPTLDPVRLPGVERSQQFLPEKAVFKGTYNKIEVTEEIAVSPEDAVEARKVTVINRDTIRRKISITSFQELGLADLETEITHPVFNGMFIQTEWVAGLSSLLAWRRPRSNDDLPLFCVHTLVEGGGGPISWDTDRGKFIGRGGTIANPRAMSLPLSANEGFVLDPIFSLRKELNLAPGERRELAFVTAAAETRAAAVSLAERYRSIAQVDQVFDLAWTTSQLNLRSLKVSAYIAAQAQQLAASLIYKRRDLRASDNVLKGPRPRVNDLWSQMISGDLPIVLLTLKKEEQVTLVQQLVSIHSLLRMQGIRFDLVIIDETANSAYFSQLEKIMYSHAYFTGVNEVGGTYLRQAAKLSEQETVALRFFADVTIKAGRGSIGTYLSTSFEYPTAKPPVKPPVPIKIPDKLKPEGEFTNGIGGFTGDGEEYRMVISENSSPPNPWINVIANPHFGTLVSESGLGMTWHDNSQKNRLTSWSNDPVSDPPSEVMYLRDDNSNEFWSVTPLPHSDRGQYVVTHGQGYSVFGHTRSGIHHELTVTVPVSDTETQPVRLQKLVLTNNGKNVANLSIMHYLELVLGQNRDDSLGSVITDWDAENDLLLAYNPRRTKHEDAVTFLKVSDPLYSFSGNRSAYLGEGGGDEFPYALTQEKLDNVVGPGFDPCFATQIKLVLAPGERREITIVFGEAETLTEAKELALRFCRSEAVDESLAQTKSWWRNKLGLIKVNIPDKASQIMLNHWLIYQVLACRVWGRSAFYQSGGAFGFRDQLQDVMALVLTQPFIARLQIITAANRQFEEGDVQHWWHADSGYGIRSRITDDLLWLPFATHRYCSVTGDYDILNEKIPYLQALPLAEGEIEHFGMPKILTDSFSLYDHCKRAVDLALSRRGIHGLPLIGTGDWNDGLSRVGIEGKGESVWLGWFLANVLDQMVEFAARFKYDDQASLYAGEAQRLRETIDGVAWDGNWYLRAFYDDNTPLGSRLDKEDSIDSLPQSWSVLSHGLDKGRQEQAMQSVYERLVRKETGEVLLFTPPFEKTEKDPGYIKGYPPGVRENGGQYTHGSLWVPQAFARLGQGGRAVEILKMMNPILKSDTPEKVSRYKVEPYVMPADVYALAGKEGQGGWTWYTGSAGWMYTIWIEDVLGIRIRGNSLRVDPSIPADWDRFEVEYRYHSAHYFIQVLNPDRVETGVVSCECNGNRVANIELQKSGIHSVIVTMGIV